MKSKVKKFIVTLAVMLTAGMTYIACSSCCVRAGTMVLTPDGPKAIETIEVGDTVLSYDHMSGTFVENTVEETYVKVGFTWIEASLADGTSLEATADHEVFDVKSNKYLPVAQVSQFKQATEDATAMSTAEGTNDRRYGATTFYDLRLSGQPHNYAANGVLVHNKSGGFIPTPLDTTAVAGTYTLDPGGTSTNNQNGFVTQFGTGTVTIGTAGQISFSFTGSTDNDPSTADPLSESGSGGALTSGTGNGPYAGVIPNGLFSDNVGNTGTFSVTVTSLSEAAGTITVSFTGTNDDATTFFGSFTAS